MDLSARRAGTPIAIGRRLGIAAVVVGMLAGCTVSEGRESDPLPDGEPTGDASAAPDARTTAGDGVLQARSSGGTEITLLRLRPEAGPLVAGPTRWRIETSGAPRNRPPTVDLVSPEMPMHGIVRFTASAAEDGAWEVDTPIPMEGRWVLYVNLDEGADAAEFALDVAPGDGGGHDHGEHGAMEADLPTKTPMHHRAGSDLDRSDPTAGDRSGDSGRTPEQRSPGIDPGPIHIEQESSDA